MTLSVDPSDYIQLRYTTIQINNTLPYKINNIVPHEAQILHSSISQPKMLISITENEQRCHIS